MISHDNESVYKKMERFSRITKSMIISGNIRRAQKCFTIAEQLYSKGNNEMKNAISNVYLYSVSTFMEWHKCSIKNLLPDTLKNEYKKQIQASGL